MRDIKGPEDCIPLDLFEVEHYGGMSVSGEYVKVKGFTAQEVGQIIALAMDAQFSFTMSVGSDMANAERKELMDKAQAWRELAERLKGNECRCTRCGHEVCVC